jgi:hypothetical protein
VVLQRQAAQRRVHVRRGRGLRAAGDLLRGTGRARDALRGDAGRLPGGAVMRAFGCGFRSSLETDEPASIADGGCDPDGEGGAHDASTGDAPPPDGALIDHGTNGPDVDAALPRCTSNADCDGWATCQSGVCCSGTLVGTVCTCGRGGGCDLRSACCVPFSSTTREL